MIGNLNAAEVEEVEVVDNHCFMFHESSKQISLADFERYYFPGGFTVGAGIDPQRNKPEVRYLMENSLAFNDFILELSRYLGSPTDPDSTISKRNAGAGAGYFEYVRNLFASENMRMLLVDNGARQVQDIDRFATSLNPVGTKKIFRLEPMIKTLLSKAEESKSWSFQTLLEKFDREIEEAVKKWNCLAFKSVIAYRVGLDIQPDSEDKAKREFKEIIDGSAKNSWFGPIAKSLRDYLFLRALERCIDLDVVMQVHTGLGDTDIVAEKCNPAFMLNALKDPRYKEAKVVLIHGGFPYTMEAGWLANSLPNVYLEISSPVPTYFAPGVSVERYRSIIQWVPIPKILYGSDASEFPETHWLMARLSKRAFSQALAQLLPDEAQRSLRERYMKMVFAENARKLYRLPS